MKFIYVTLSVACVIVVIVIQMLGLHMFVIGKVTLDLALATLVSSLLMLYDLERNNHY
ncbi:hypothetical protein JZO77_19020 [Enterococcus hulanensis]|uniref:hypothetical protein n=1 Tax=Enterococcus hulanensis TaxID=2559929 RepID=UPI0014855DB2|nr:hypothetical protein [Enterococcus hulanensis]MBO0458831.1 hypothetical protein [Enterococcus hulanensis]